MIRKFLFLACICCAWVGFSQEVVYGPMLSYDSTTFSIPDTSVIIVGGAGGFGVQDLGSETNFSAGAFLYYYPADQGFYGGELFYSRHTATEAEGVSVESINLIPQFGFDPLNINLFLNGGIGIGYLYAIDGFNDFNDFNDLTSIDLAVKLGVSYRLKNIITLEAGLRGALTNFESNNEVSRQSFYGGVKIPLSQIFQK